MRQKPIVRKEEEFRRRRPHYWRVSTYLIVDSTPRDGVFITNFGFLIFPRFRLFPWEINQNLSERKKKPDHIEYDRVSFYIFDARLLIPWQN